MKKGLLLSIIVLFALMCLSTAAFTAGGKMAKGKEVTVTGQLSCTFCKLSNPAKPCEKGCCEKCVKAGDSPLLTDAKGNQYVLVTGEKEATLMTPERTAMLGSQVTVKGVMVKGKGIQAIYVDSMAKK